MCPTEFLFHALIQNIFFRIYCHMHQVKTGNIIVGNSVLAMKVRIYEKVSFFLFQNICRVSVGKGSREFFSLLFSLSLSLMEEENVF